MKGTCAACARPLKDKNMVVKGKVTKVQICKSPICKSYGKPQ